MADPVSGPPFPWPQDFRKNSAEFPVEELHKYIGQHIAWSWDGTRIVAAASTDEELNKKLEELGVEFSDVVFDYVDDPAISRIGGFL
jgi:hypothetical protein